MAAAGGQGELGFSPMELWGVLSRRFWWLVIPSGIGLVASLILALVWPAEYEAEAIVAVEPQDIPTHLVLPTVGTDTEAAFNAIRLRILARDKLSQIIDDLNLYPERAGDPRESVIIHMRNYITIDPLPPAVIDPRKPVQIESFRIAFRDRSPEIARDVANRLEREFRAANLDQRANQAQGTSEFIQAELQRGRRERERVGLELSVFKEKYRGELPEDMPINQQRLARLNIELTQVRSALETSAAQVGRLKVEIDEVRSHGPAEETFDPARRQQAAEIELSQHLARGKTEKHPDVVISRAEIAELDGLIAANKENDDRPMSHRESSLARELREHEVRQLVLGREIKRLNTTAAEYEDRIVISPRRGAAIGHLEAQYQSLTEAIEVLQAKKVAADMGQAVELAQKGEKFQVVEIAVLPSQPVSPNRPLFVLVGTVLGLLAGLSLLAVREIADESFHTVRDLQGTLGLPVLGTIPAIEVAGGAVVREGGMRRWIGTSLVVLALGAGVVGVYAARQVASEAHASAEVERGERDV